MIDTFHRRDAEHAFHRALRRGRRDTNLFARLRRRDNRVLRLSDLLAVVPRRGEAYRGLHDIPVDRVVGTENRGDDYSRAFHPRKRSLSARWTALHRLMSHTEFNEPIVVIEAGGVFFVRDGNHRVSVARALDRTFINAEVTRYEMPFSLPKDLDRNGLRLLRGKAQFHRATGVFDILDDREFVVACPRTWEFLEREIRELNYAWFVRRFGRHPEDRAEQVLTWYNNLYRHAIDFIRANHDTYLFPGMSETDVFVEMLRLWNSHENPDGQWFGEVYREFVARQRRRQLLRAVPQAVRNAVAAISSSPEDEYRRFMAVSRAEEIVPGFRPLPKQSGFYRFLHRQLVHDFALGLKPELGRAPHIQELTELWHARFYGPVAGAARQLPDPAAQTSFYRRFGRRYLLRVLGGDIAVEQALREFTAPAGS